MCERTNDCNEDEICSGESVCERLSCSSLSPSRHANLHLNAEKPLVGEDAIVACEEVEAFELSPVQLKLNTDDLLGLRHSKSDRRFLPEK